MKSEIKQLSEEMQAFIEQAQRVRAVLQSYTKVSAELVRRVEKGELLADVLEDLEGPTHRREVTEAVEELVQSRHRVRLAMFALGRLRGAAPANWVANLVCRASWRRVSQTKRPKPLANPTGSSFFEPGRGVEETAPPSDVNSC